MPVYVLLNCGNKAWHSFFPNRQIIGGIAVFATNFLAGRYLGENPDMIKFIILFSVVTFLGIFHSISVLKIPVPSETQTKSFEIKKYLRNVKKCVTNEKYYILLISQFIKWFGLSMTAPFIVLFLLEEIQIDYFQIATLINVSLVVGLVSYKIIGYLTKKFGNYSVFKYSAIIGFFIPVLFSISSSNYYFLFYLIFFLNGIFESSWLVSGFGITFDYAGPENRSIYNSLFMFSGGIGAIGAPVIGGFLVRFFNSMQINMNILGLSFTSYRILFLIGSVFAVISVILLFLNKVQSRIIGDGQPIQ